MPFNPYQRQEHIHRISDATCRSFGSIAKQGHVVSIDEYDANLRDYDIYIGVKHPRLQEGLSLERRFFSPHLFNLPRVKIRNKMTDCSRSLERSNNNQPAGLVVYCTRDIALNPPRTFSIQTSHDFHPIYKRDIYTFDFIRFEPGNNDRYVCRVSPFRFLFQHMTYSPYKTRMIQKDNYIEFKHVKSRKSCAQLCASYWLKTLTQLEGDFCRGIFVIEASKWAKSTLDQTYCANIYRGFSAPGLGVYLSFTLPGQDLYQLSAPFCYDPRIASEKSQIYIPFTTENGNDFCIIYRRNLSFTESKDFCKLHGMILIPFSEISKSDKKSWKSSVLFKALFSEENEEVWSGKRNPISTICNYFTVPEYPLHDAQNLLISQKEDSCAQRKSAICLRRMLGSWGPWSSWSDCLGKGNYGEYTRSRKCDNPYPLPTIQRTGLFCEENNFNFIMYEKKYCRKSRNETNKQDEKKKEKNINGKLNQFSDDSIDLDPSRLMKNIEGKNGMVDFFTWNNEIFKYCLRGEKLKEMEKVTSIQECENICYENTNCLIYAFDDRNKYCFWASSYCTKVEAKLKHNAYFKTAKLCQLSEGLIKYPFVFDPQPGYCLTYLGVHNYEQAHKKCKSLKMHLIKYEMRQKLSIEYYIQKKLPLEVLKIWNGLISSDLTTYYWDNSNWKDEELIQVNDRRFRPINPRAQCSVAVIKNKVVIWETVNCNSKHHTICWRPIFGEWSPWTFKNCNDSNNVCAFRNCQPKPFENLANNCIGESMIKSKKYLLNSRWLDSTILTLFTTIFGLIITTFCWLMVKSNKINKSAASNSNSSNNS